MDKSNLFNSINMSDLSLFDVCGMLVVPSTYSMNKLIITDTMTQQFKITQLDLLENHLWSLIDLKCNNNESTTFNNGMMIESGSDKDNMIIIDYLYLYKQSNIKYKNYLKKMKMNKRINNIYKNNYPIKGNNNNKYIRNFIFRNKLHTYKIIKFKEEIKNYINDQSQNDGVINSMKRISHGRMEESGGMDLQSTNDITAIIKQDNNDNINYQDTINRMDSNEFKIKNNNDNIISNDDIDNINNNYYIKDNQSNDQTTRDEIIIDINMNNDNTNKNKFKINIKKNINKYYLNYRLIKNINQKIKRRVDNNKQIIFDILNYIKLDIIIINENNQLNNKSIKEKLEGILTYSPKSLINNKKITKEYIIERVEHYKEDVYSTKYYTNKLTKEKKTVNKLLKSRKYIDYDYSMIIYNKDEKMEGHKAFSISQGEFTLNSYMRLDQFKINRVINHSEMRKVYEEMKKLYKTKGFKKLYKKNNLREILSFTEFDNNDNKLRPVITNNILKFCLELNSRSDFKVINDCITDITLSSDILSKKSNKINDSNKINRFKIFNNNTKSLIHDLKNNKLFEYNYFYNYFYNTYNNKNIQDDTLLENINNINIDNNFENNNLTKIEDLTFSFENDDQSIDTEENNLKLNNILDMIKENKINNLREIMDNIPMNKTNNNNNNISNKNVKQLNNINIKNDDTKENINEIENNTNDINSNNKDNTKVNINKMKQKRQNKKENKIIKDNNKIKLNKIKNDNTVQVEEDKINTNLIINNNSFSSKSKVDNQIIVPYINNSYDNSYHKYKSIYDYKLLYSIINMVPINENSSLNNQRSMINDNNKEALKLKNYMKNIHLGIKFQELFTYMNKSGYQCMTGKVFIAQQKKKAFEMELFKVIRLFKTDVQQFLENFNLMKFDNFNLNCQEKRPKSYYLKYGNKSKKQPIDFDQDVFNEEDIENLGIIDHKDEHENCTDSNINNPMETNTKESNITIKEYILECVRKRISSLIHNRFETFKKVFEMFQALIVLEGCDNIKLHIEENRLCIMRWYAFWKCLLNISLFNGTRFLFKNIKGYISEKRLDLFESNSIGFGLLKHELKTSSAMYRNKFDKYFVGPLSTIVSGDSKLQFTYLSRAFPEGDLESEETDFIKFRTNLETDIKVKESYLTELKEFVSRWASRMVHGTMGRIKQSYSACLNCPRKEGGLMKDLVELSESVSGESFMKGMEFKNDNKEKQEVEEEGKEIYNIMKTIFLNKRNIRIEIKANETDTNIDIIMRRIEEELSIEEFSPLDNNNLDSNINQSDITIIEEVAIDTESIINTDVVTQNMNEQQNIDNIQNENKNENEHIVQNDESQNNNLQNDDNVQDNNINDNNLQNNNNNNDNDAILINNDNNNIDSIKITQECGISLEKDNFIYDKELQIIRRLKEKRDDDINAKFTANWRYDNDEVEDFMTKKKKRLLDLEYKLDQLNDLMKSSECDVDAIFRDDLITKLCVKDILCKRDEGEMIKLETISIKERGYKHRYVTKAPSMIIILLSRLQTPFFNGLCKDPRVIDLLNGDRNAAIEGIFPAYPRVNTKKIKLTIEKYKSLNEEKCNSIYNFEDREENAIQTLNSYERSNIEKQEINSNYFDKDDCFCLSSDLESATDKVTFSVIHSIIDGIAKGWKNCPVWFEPVMKYIYSSSLITTKIRNCYGRERVVSFETKRGALMGYPCNWVFLNLIHLFWVEKAIQLSNCEISINNNKILYGERGLYNQILGRFVVENRRRKKRDLNLIYESNKRVIDGTSSTHQKNEEKRKKNIARYYKDHKLQYLIPKSARMCISVCGDDLIGLLPRIVIKNYHYIMREFGSNISPGKHYISQKYISFTEIIVEVKTQNKIIKVNNKSDKFMDSMVERTDDINNLNNIQVDNIQGNNMQRHNIQRDNIQVNNVQRNNTTKNTNKITDVQNDDYNTNGIVDDNNYSVVDNINKDLINQLNSKHPLSYSYLERAKKMAESKSKSDLETYNENFPSLNITKQEINVHNRKTKMKKLIEKIIKNNKDKSLLILNINNIFSLIRRKDMIRKIDEDFDIKKADLEKLGIGQFIGHLAKDVIDKSEIRINKKNRLIEISEQKNAGSLRHILEYKEKIYVEQSYLSGYERRYHQLETKMAGQDEGEKLLDRTYVNVRNNYNNKFKEVQLLNNNLRIKQLKLEKLKILRQDKLVVLIDEIEVEIKSIGDKLKLHCLNPDIKLIKRLYIEFEDYKLKLTQNSDDKNRLIKELGKLNDDIVNPQPLIEQFSYKNLVILSSIKTLDLLPLRGLLRSDVPRNSGELTIPKWMVLGEIYNSTCDGNINKMKKARRLIYHEYGDMIKKLVYHKLDPFVPRSLGGLGFPRPRGPLNLFGNLGNMNKVVAIVLYGHNNIELLRKLTGFWSFCHGGSNYAMANEHSEIRLKVLELKPSRKRKRSPYGDSTLSVGLYNDFVETSTIGIERELNFIFSPDPQSLTALNFRNLSKRWKVLKNEIMYVWPSVKGISVDAPVSALNNQRKNLGQQFIGYINKTLLPEEGFGGINLNVSNKKFLNETYHVE